MSVPGLGSFPRWLVCLALMAAGCSTDNEQVATERNMTNEEQAIRSALDTFIKASETGDLEAAKSVIAEDAVFFVPHAGTMDRESYATAATAKPEGDEKIEFDLTVDIKEIKIMGDHAYVWLATQLTITPESGDATQWAGHTLSILEKRDGDWLVVRDANTLLPVQQ